MAKKDDVHWVVVWSDESDEVSCIKYSSRRTAVRGASRVTASGDWIAAVVAEDGDTLEVYEFFYWGPEACNCISTVDVNETLEAWNYYWGGGET